MKSPGLGDARELALDGSVDADLFGVEGTVKIALVSTPKKGGVTELSAVALASWESKSETQSVGSGGDAGTVLEFALLPI